VESSGLLNIVSIYTHLTDIRNLVRARFLRSDRDSVTEATAAASSAADTAAHRAAQRCLRDARLQPLPRITPSTLEEAHSFVGSFFGGLAEGGRVTDAKKGGGGGAGGGHGLVCCNASARRAATSSSMARNARL
jgi:hypothetical protein